MAEQMKEIVWFWDGVMGQILKGKKTLSGLVVDVVSSTWGTDLTRRFTLTVPRAVRTEVVQQLKADLLHSLLGNVARQVILDR